MVLEGIVEHDRAHAREHADLAAEIVGHEGDCVVAARRWRDLTCEPTRQPQALFQVLTLRDGRIVRIDDQLRESIALRAIGRAPDRPEPPSLGSTVVPSLTARSLEETIDFYRDRLGFTLTGRHPAQGTPAWAELTRDGICLHFSKGRGEEPALAGVLYLAPSDVTALYEEFASYGVETEWGPAVMDYGMREFAIRDPNGYLLGFWEEAE